MKKIIRLTESDLARIVKQVIREQYNKETSGDEDWKSKLKSYESKMDNFLSQLKDSGVTIDKKRFLKQIQKETDQMYWDVYDNSDSEPEGFVELQLDLMKRFRQKLNESDLARIVRRTIMEMEVNGDPQSMLESMIDEIGESVIENSYFGSLTEFDDMESFSSTVAVEANDRLQEEGFSNMKVDFQIYYGGTLEFFIFDNDEEEIVATYRPDFF